ncbi:MAG: glycerol-3-phosphate dehydrogenase [Sandaracinaceae bacterium]|nr:glycerol-3-phosphate dehydrogenase [Sandaracinaceae bacterium]
MNQPNDEVSLRQSSMWARVGTSEVDVLIIGGGINGAGIARDAAARGLRVLLCEQNDLAFGTSSRSSKLVHGGLRYLEQGELGLVFESVSERGTLMKLAPHLVTPLGFLVPIYKGRKPGLATIRAGILLYEGLSLFRSPKPARSLSPAQAAEAAPGLSTKNLRGAPLYYDCATDDARLTLESAIDAAARGAIISSWTRVEKLHAGAGGLVRGATVRNVLTNETREVKCSIVVNATGPWTDRTLSMAAPGPRWLRPTKGVHLVVPREKLPMEHCVACFHPKDNRYLFVIPWGDHTYVGTTDTDYDGKAEEVCASHDDVRYLLACVHHYFPERQIDESDVVSTWAGLRPLIDPGDDVSESKVSREERIEASSDGIVTVAGGKLTTYRAMASDVVDAALEQLALRGAARTDLRDPKTEHAPLPGGVSFPEGGLRALVATLTREAGGALSEATVQLLASTYGTQASRVIAIALSSPALAAPLSPGRPEIVAQVDYAIEHELAATLCDVEVRRTQLFFRAADQGLSAIPAIAARFVAKLGWSEEIVARESARYEAEVALSRRWRSEG